MTEVYNIVIRNGTVVDGKGGVPYVGDIALKDGLIAAIGRVDGVAAEEIDARGKLVTPGFIDIHTHYDGQVTWENTLTPSSGHGITTAVMGNCGVGFAPIRMDQRQLAIKLMEGVEDIPEVVMAEGVPFNWETFPEYLDALEQRRTDIDFAAQLPHSPLRVYVMGQRGADLEPPTDDDLAQMRRLTAEAIEAGAVGVSTSRQLAHRFRDGRLAPSVPTEVQELLALAAGMRDADAGVFQIIPNTDRPAKEEFDVVRRFAEASGRPVSFSLATGDIVHTWRDYLSGMEKARADGLPVSAQFLPRPSGMLFGLDLSFHAFSLNPSYRGIAHLPLAERVKIMRDPSFRARLLLEDADDSNQYLTKVVSRTHPLFILGDPPNYLPKAESSIRAMAARRGISERELIYDALLENDGYAILYFAAGNTEGDRVDLGADLLGVPGAVVALGDGGAHYGMICDGGYSTFLLIEFVRKAASARQLTIEKAVSMLSREPAEAMGFHDRGVLETGRKADLNVIDLDRLCLHAPRMRPGLPAGGRRLVQQADGYEATIVSGEVTYREGIPTGALPGRLVRGGRKSRQAV